MNAGEQSRADSAHGNNIIRESSSSPEPPGPLRRRFPHLPRLPRRWSWRFRMPSRHPMILRSHSRGVAASPSGSSLAGAQPPSHRITVQTPREAGRVLGNPVTPDRQAGRAWFDSHSETQNFVVFEDTESQETLQALTPVLYSGPSEERENTDVEPVEEEPASSRNSASPHNSVNWSTLETGPRDVFGLPFRLPLPPHPPTGTAAAAANVGNDPVHSDFQGTVWGDDDETDEDRDETISVVLLRELWEIGYFDRASDNEQETPVRRGPGQAQAQATPLPPQAQRAARPRRQDNLRPRNN